MKSINPPRKKRHKKKKKENEFPFESETLRVEHDDDDGVHGMRDRLYV